MSKIHPTAIIDKSCEIDTSVEIGAYSVIGKNVSIQKNTIIGPHVVISSNCEIGENNKIYQFASLAEIPQDKKYQGEDCKLIIGAGNTIREYCTINRGTKAGGNSITQVGNNNWIMAYVHIAHDCIVGDDNVFANNSGIAGHVIVGNNVTIGGLTTVHQFCQIGDFSFAGMNTSITMDVPAFIKVASNPARVVGLNSVGMERGGIDSDTINTLKKAYKIIYRKGLNLKDAIKKIESMKCDHKEISVLVDSLKSSKRGILR